jgi:hypothetical protein
MVSKGSGVGQYFSHKNLLYPQDGPPAAGGATRRRLSQKVLRPLLWRKSRHPKEKSVSRFRITPPGSPLGERGQTHFTISRQPPGRPVAPAAGGRAKGSGLPGATQDGLRCSDSARGEGGISNKVTPAVKACGAPYS